MALMVVSLQVWQIENLQLDMWWQKKRGQVNPALLRS